MYCYRRVYSLKSGAEVLLQSDDQSWARSFRHYFGGLSCHRAWRLNDEGTEHAAIAYPFLPQPPIPLRPAICSAQKIPLTSESIYIIGHWPMINRVSTEELGARSSLLKVEHELFDGHEIASVM